MSTSSPIRQVLDKAVAELASAGVANSSGYAVEDSSRLVLTSNTFSFSLAYLQLVDHLMQLFSPGTRHLVNESLVSVLHAHLRHMEAAARANEPKADPRIAGRQAAFLLDCILPLTEHRWVPSWYIRVIKCHHRYGERTQGECPKLAKLHSNYCWLKDGSKGPSVAKYSDPNYV